MSQPAISDTTNRPNPPKVGINQNLSVPPSATPLLIPSYAPAQSPNRDTYGGPGHEVVYSEVNNGHGLLEQNEPVT